MGLQGSDRLWPSSKHTHADSAGRWRAFGPTDRANRVAAPRSATDEAPSAALPVRAVFHSDLFTF